MSQGASIISLVNALYAPPGQQQQQHQVDDRLDAARALLGVSPSSVADTNGPTSPFGGRGDKDMIKQSNEATSAPVLENDDAVVVQRRSRSDSVGLDALAFCATNEQVSLSGGTSDAPAHAVEPQVVPAPACLSSSDEDSESMPPPPPRMVTRRRSVSNPEGMDRRSAPKSHRLHLVLPASILEEELAEANAAMKAKEDDDVVDGNNEKPLPSEDVTLVKQEETQEEEEFLDQDELLRRARSRLLEDLSQGNLNGDKGVLTLPHSLEKYKEVYNKNGRIGIYTPAERAAIINRFQSKRTRRVWNKKIRYNCRKNLADRRMRVKGRFVKRSTEDQAKTPSTTNDVIPEGEEATFVTPDASSADEEMPDVTDPDAGFCPTDDQPYRRLRRHTIT